MVGPDQTNEVISTVLHRDAESIVNYDPYKATVKLYLQHNILKYFGLTIDQFMLRTRYDRDILIDLAIERTKEMVVLAEKTNNDLNKLTGDYEDD